MTKTSTSTMAVLVAQIRDEVYRCEGLFREAMEPDLYSWADPELLVKSACEVYGQTTARLAVLRTLAVGTGFEGEVASIAINLDLSHAMFAASL